ncbi:periplasmic heavy metal sensor [bacterium]|nr:periplasmic heavy metal sensor [bacterium]
MTRTWLIVLLISLGLNLGLAIGLLVDRPAAPADAPPPPRGERWRHRDTPPREMADRLMRRRIEHMTRELDLDEQQRARLWDLHEQRGESIVGRRREQVELRRELHELLMSPQSDWEAVRAVMAEQSRVQAALDSTVVRIMFEERQVLTDEQRARYHEFVFPLQPGGDGPRGRRQGPGHRRGQRP